MSNSQTPNSLEWYQGLPQDPEYLVEDAKIGFAVAVERLMGQCDLTKTALAQRLGVTPAYITKVLRGDANLTIKTMVEVADAVDGTLHLHIAPKRAGVRWLEVLNNTMPDNSSQVSAAQTWARHRTTSTGIAVVCAA